MSESGYILKNADAVASTRLDVLASIFDPWTRAHLDARGLPAGWRCWEVGAGGPSKGLVAAGLATEAEIARHVDNVSRGLVTPLMAPLITAWGCK